MSDPSKKVKWSYMSTKELSALKSKTVKLEKRLAGLEKNLKILNKNLKLR